MRSTFNYKEKFSWGFVFLALFGLGGIIYAYLQPINIRLGSLTILQYPNSQYVIWIVGTLFIAYALHKWLKINATKNNSEPITFSENEMQFNILQGYSLQKEHFLLSDVCELWNNTDNDDGESMIIYTSTDKKRFEFFAENFDTAEQFAEFKKILEQKCTNITNR